MLSARAAGENRWNKINNEWGNGKQISSLNNLAPFPTIFEATRAQGPLVFCRFHSK
jgi:hypothetical protein